jgi:hypothetical protein
VRSVLGGRWAAVAVLLSVLTALVRRMGPYLLLLHRALLLAQVYLAIYFATLALAVTATGLEPLRFFRAASPPPTPGRRLRSPLASACVCGGDHGGDGKRLWRL